ncbi:MAG: hypothetical protein PUC26_00525 [Eubacteriales bacterium]|nr:hypothetical protein [Eubacteriales bacterium]
MIRQRMICTAGNDGSILREDPGHACAEKERQQAHDSTEYEGNQDDVHRLQEECKDDWQHEVQQRLFTIGPLVNESAVFFWCIEILLLAAA